MEIANSVDPVQDGRIHIEKINWPFLSEFKGSPAEYSAGLKLARRLALDARERDLREDHRCWRSAVRLDLLSERGCSRRLVQRAIAHVNRP